ncbi:hypothetical protein DBV15_12145 [Temnothorax longispinosus]|uniref:Partial AB-hydrolase lipase domain-containing protein n=1 Tax=Temnothorax longispinosus TaxID=300112 RepID=A0A4S2JHK3_9HYME|nr:hypothetical protein DBV15_12145 [Temnothorax longispinosus]
MKSTLLAFLIIMTFSKGRLQGISSFLQNEFLKFLFPKDPGLVRVRRMDRAEEINSGKILDFIGLIERYNYPAEEHNVTTEDGYNLKVHRIPGSPLLDGKKKKEIVFMQHALLASSDSWVLRGPSKDLGTKRVALSDGNGHNSTILPDIFSYLPAGTSVQTLEHFYQNIRMKDFRNYDYGIAENYKRYKQKTAPSYDLKKITAPIILFYSANDMIVTKENVLELGKRLPNVLLTEEVPYKLFNHLDFTWAINAKTLLYHRVLELIQKFDADQNKPINLIDECKLNGEKP